MPRIGPAIVALLLTVLSGCAARDAAGPPYYQVKTNKPYDDVLAELEVAISEQNFRITGHNHIGSVIRSRENIDFPDYDTIQFCNLTLARQMLEISPAAVVYMPCNISVRSENGRVIIATHLLPVDTSNEKLNEFANTMNERLRRIVDFAAEN